MVRSTDNVTPVRRPRRATPVSDLQQNLLLYITNWRSAKLAGEARDKANKVIKTWFASGSYGDRDVSVNDNGSQILTFDEPLLIDGSKYTALENRRTVRSELDLDLVDAWLATLPKARADRFRSRLYKKVVTEEFDSDELFKLQQEGVISEAALDDMFESKETWALCVVKD